MLEYNIEDNNEEFLGRPFNYELTQLKDGHYLIINPCSYEAKFNFENENYEKLPTKEFITMNTINHTAVPTDSKDSEWFSFLDNDYKYMSDDNIEQLNDSDYKTKSYAKYCTNPVTNKPGFYYGTAENNEIKWDNIKLYFSSGYDFSDIFGALFRLYVETIDGNYLDLCNIFFTKSNIYKYITYMAKPIVFGNIVYDKYLNIKVFSLNSLEEIRKDMPNCSAKNSLSFGIKSKDPNIPDASKGWEKMKIPPVKLLFSYVEDENYTLENIEFKQNNSVYEDSIIFENTGCYFARANSIKGTIPRDKINSDNIGLYIANVPNYPYIEFYGMWKGVPLSTDIVQKFNIDIPLYNSSIIKKSSTTYEISKDYKVEYNLKKWIAMHEIEADVIEENNDELKVLKSETYTQSQIFIGEENESVKFYYRPVIFDDNISLKIAKGECAMAIKYTLRLMNIEDSVQFIKSGSITLHGDSLTKFCHKTTSLNFSDRLPYKIYNKIVENKQVIESPAQGINGLTKYVKHFYDSTTIVLDVDGVPLTNNQYTMQLSQVPKNYKFVFKEKDNNDNLKYIDLTDSYYKLFTHDAYGGEIVIEPTYSKNMNLLLGELEFNIGSANINKLREVPETNRQMTIVAYNVDNTTSAMYDFYYTI